MSQFKKNLKDAWEEDRIPFIINLLAVVFSIIALILSTICMIEKYWS